MLSRKLLFFFKVFQTASLVDKSETNFESIAKHLHRWLQVSVFNVKPTQIIKWNFLTKIANRLKTLPIFTKNSILDVWLGSEYTSTLLALSVKHSFNIFSKIWRFLSEQKLNKHGLRLRCTKYWSFPLRISQIA